MRKKTARPLRYLFFFFFCIASAMTLAGQETGESRSEYSPDIDVILKTKVEYDLNRSLIRFEVRNARFGLKGKINNVMSYRAELDLSDEGKMKMLDAYVRFSPVKNLDFYLGQRKIPFSTDYMRNPAENIFANRSFLSKYINDGMRDIGFYAEYKFNMEFPLQILLGTVNGTGNNNPQWISKPNFVGRLIAGPEKGFRAVFNLYSGETKDMEKLAMIGGELRYSTGALHLESEYIRRNWTDTLSVRQYDDGLYIHSYYNFIFEEKFFYSIAPVFRWDLIGNSVFNNKINANRITLGVNIGFEPRQFYSEIRLNYENYLTGNLPVHTDKITLEFIARF
ncbi:MAG TPA: porin [Bacteroidales bacterium]|jgi:hypothetical protein|nr:porin [Bacteroidales bacterium]